jgi:hypothetical protein
MINAQITALDKQVSVNAAHLPERWAAFAGIS